MLRRSAAIIVAALILGATAAVPVQGAVVVKATFTRSGDPRFQPRRTEVSPGARVTWKAVVGSHTVTSYRGAWSKSTTVAQGQQTSFTFASQGTFRFRCRFHSTLVDGVCTGMCGKVVAK